MNTFICRNCGKSVTKSNPQSVYCSKACMAEDYKKRLVGANNPAWKGGGDGYAGENFVAMSEFIHSRDKVCTDCGGSKHLSVHHKIPQRFWLKLEDSNTEDNLVLLCRSCHFKRPEHYWVELPKNLYDPKLHLPEPPERTAARLRKKPVCPVCGKTCKGHRNRYCSYSCSNKARWKDGVYDASLVKNFGDPPVTRWNKKEK